MRWGACEPALLFFFFVYQQTSNVISATYPRSLLTRAYRAAVPELGRDDGFDKAPLSAPPTRTHPQMTRTAATARDPGRWGGNASTSPPPADFFGSLRRTHARLVGRSTRWRPRGGAPTGVDSRVPRNTSVLSFTTRAILVLRNSS